MDQTHIGHESLNLNAEQEELQLLDDGTSGAAESGEHEVKTAPLFTRDAKIPAGFCPHRSQYGLLGSLMGIKYVTSEHEMGTVIDYHSLGKKHEQKFRQILDCTSTR